MWKIEERQISVVTWNDEHFRVCFDKIFFAKISSITKKYYVSTFHVQKEYTRIINFTCSVPLRHNSTEKFQCCRQRLNVSSISMSETWRQQKMSRTKVLSSSFDSTKSIKGTNGAIPVPAANMSKCECWKPSMNGLSHLLQPQCIPPCRRRYNLAFRKYSR